MTILPVLVEGAVTPSADELPADLARLSKINALELTNRTWRHDVQAIVDVALRHDARARRALRAVRRRARPIAAVAALAVAGTVAAVLATRGPSTGTDRARPVLAPATTPSRVDVCTHKVQVAVDGTVLPSGCGGGGVNSLAWQYYANSNLLITSIGESATPGRMLQARDRAGVGATIIHARLPA